MIIKIIYNGEKIIFNLGKEARINEDDLEKELQGQPNKYGFLLLLHKKILTEFEKAKVAKKKKWAHLYLQAKESTTTGRPMNDTMAEATADKHPGYIELCHRCIELKDQADSIFAAVRTFEQKKDLMQTLSSNLRAQR